MSSSTLPTLPFSDNKQESIVAWALQDQPFFEGVSRAIKPSDLRDIYVKAVYAAALAFHEKHKRLPTVAEIQQEHGFTHADKLIRDKMILALHRLPGARQEFGLDVLRLDVERWSKAKIVLETVTKFQRTYLASIKDESKLDEALALFDEGAERMEKASLDDPSSLSFSNTTLDAFDAIRERRKDNSTRLSFGHPYLDDALGGISQRDLILLGAKTGAGKTELATMTARHNIREGKHVYFFALEAEPDEIQNRALYSIVSSRFYARGGRCEPGELSYDRWMRGLCDKQLGPLETEAEAELAKEFETLHTLYRHSGQFSVDDLEKHIADVKDQADLIILDHIHYVDIDDDRNENASYKRVIKTLNDCALSFGVPIIVIAHLRKTQQFNSKAILPSIEDFHGTSDLPKIATKAILVGRGERSMEMPKWISPTLIKVAKNRRSGDATRYVAEVQFDLKTNTYLQTYRLSQLRDFDTKIELVADSEIPYWATRAERIKK